MNRINKTTAAAVLAVLTLMTSVTTSGCGAAGVQPSAQAEVSGSMTAQNASDSAADASTAQTTVTSTQMNTLNDRETLNIADDKYRTTYEVFLYSYYDSNGDGIGDIQGLIDKLDYINDGDDTTGTDLGCNEIWLMPVCPSPSYHKYDVTDYEAIDPQYGTMDDFKELVAQCHKRGIRIITDMVMNHTSTEHPWFTKAADYLKKLPAGE